MRRWFFYHLLAWNDIIRLWPTTQHQVVIIAGICLPILLLLGLKRGHVTELRKELLTSPSGRQIVFWSAQGGQLLDSKVLNELAEKTPNVDVIIAEAQRSVDIEPVATGTDAIPSSLVTLYSTHEGDPVLAQYDADVLRPDKLEVVLSDRVAERLKLSVGDDVRLQLRRRREAVEETHALIAKVAALIPAAHDGSQTGYAHLSLLKAIEQYVRGYTVPKYRLPAIRGLAARDEYYTYLLFCQKGAQTELQADDFRFFDDRGIECKEIDDAAEKSLFGILDASRLSELRVYRLQQRSPEGTGPAPLHQSPLFISENTQAVDDFVLRWNDPLEVICQGEKQRLIGLSLPTVTQTGGWIRDYLTSSPVGFGFEQSQAEPFQLQTFPKRVEQSASTTILLSDGTNIPLSWARADDLVKERTDEPADREDKTEPQPEAQPTPESVPPTLPLPQGPTESSTDSEDKPPKEAFEESPESAPFGCADQEAVERSLLLVVPANMLAWMHGHLSGTARYDEQGHTFTPHPEPVIFDKARLYTHTIDNVPAAVEYLSQRRYAVLSESNRIAEIQTQDQSLQLLVVVVAIGVLFFGIVTVVSVLVDSTDRKRGTIGILRVMGMSRAGVFYIVIIRALIIGLLAALLSLGLGYGFAWLLGQGPQDLGWPVPWRAVNVVFLEADLLTVLAGALACAGVGAIVPAWRAGTIDPFDAIMEGRLH